ncbi:Uncharacterized protein dnm_012010 [Desulfonema magnum]|uniref:Uncharacterized protein n=1 Tax=Desulfonema magnum TaxID=45655 RepID=A0A975GKW7_9BACT|nr:Uncharacterized protein dnm_012010 [Desulfonema magnum]
MSSLNSFPVISLYFLARFLLQFKKTSVALTRKKFDTQMRLKKIENAPPAHR